MKENPQSELAEYLSRVRFTIRKSQRILEDVRLRARETDRLLEECGTSRAEVSAMRFSPIQLAMVGAELRRRGFDCSTEIC